MLDIALTTSKPFSTSTKWPPLFPLYRGRYQLRRFPGSPCFSEPEAVQGACPLLSPTDCMAQSWRPATPLPGVQGQGWVARAFPARKSGCHTLTPYMMPGSRPGSPRGAPARVNNVQAGRVPAGRRPSLRGGAAASGGAGAGCAPRAGHQASPPLLAAPGPPPPPPRSPSRAARRSSGSGRTNFLLGCGRRGCGGARTPRPPRVPTTLLRARRGRRGAPEGGGRAPGRCGAAAAAAAGSARPDRRPRGECARVAGRGPRARGPRAGAGRGRRLGRRRGRGRAGVPGPRARSVPARGAPGASVKGPRDPGPRAPGPPSPTWRPGWQLSRSLWVNGPEERVCLRVATALGGRRQGARV